MKIIVFYKKISSAPVWAILNDHSLIWYHDITLWYCDMIYDAKNIAIHKYSGPAFGPTELGRKW